MKNNLNELLMKRLPELQSMKVIDINEILNEIMPLIVFEERPTKAEMAREIIRSRLTSLLNANDIYSCEKGNKGHFVYLGNADEDQLKYFKDKANRDIQAAETRKNKAEELLHQISMAWDENGQFIGFHIPPAINL